MITIRQERKSDIAAREALLDAAYGDVRFAKPSERLRRNAMPAAGLSFVAVENASVIGTVRLWNMAAGPTRPVLLLGPLAVDPGCRRRGIGSALMRRALAAARRRGHQAVLLVGDASYYGRFGFSAETTRALWLPGHYEPDRLLGLELQPGALRDVRGTIRLPTAPVARRVADARRDRIAPCAA